METSTIVLVALLISAIVVAHMGYMMFLTVGGTVYAVRDRKRERAGRKATREGPRETTRVARRGRARA